MRRLNKTILFVLFIISSNYFYGQKGFVTGLGGTYGSDIESFGVNIREYMFLGHQICFGPEVSFFPEHQADGYNKSLLELNITGHYIFDVNEHVGIYPLTGLNYSIEKEELHGESETKKAFGLNLGIGFHYKVKNVFPFIEYKYIVGNLAQHIVSFGILFSLKKQDKEEPH